MRTVCTLRGPAAGRERLLAACRRYGVDVLQESAQGGTCSISVIVGDREERFSVEKALALLPSWRLVHEQYVPRRLRLRAAAA